MSGLGVLIRPFIATEHLWRRAVAVLQPERWDVHMPILRLPQVQAQLGYSRSRFYLDVQRGLLPKQIKTGERASGLPDFEVAAIERAIIAGASDDERRALVQRLHKARSANRMQVG